MRLAIPFKNHFELNKVADEFNIYYNPNENDLNDLIAFIKEFPQKQINITYRNGVDFKTASAIASLSDNVRFKLRASDLAATGRLLEKGCKFFFSEDNPCCSFRDLQSFVEELHVDEVYVADDLCYNLTNVRKYCDKHNVKVRVVLNTVPMTHPSISETIQIWMPRDADELSDYFDVAEFNCGHDKSYDFKKLAVLYKIWFVKKDWAGDMQEINDWVPLNYYCRTIIPSLGHTKFNCRLKCLSEGASCSKCLQAMDLSESMLERSYQFEMVKK